jgi:hypothetical protein
VAIITQVFYNLECGRYALYCGEPIFTGFMRCVPGPRFWMAVILLLNASALIPGLTTHGAAMVSALWTGSPPTQSSHELVSPLAFILLAAVALPVFLGGKVYNVLQTIMTLKVVIVLAFCLVIGIVYVSPANWCKVLSGFVMFGTVPTGTEEQTGSVNLIAHWWRTGDLPEISLSHIAVIGAFAGYAGGGGLANATYGNFVRDKGWGMGSVVGAIPSAVGGHGVTLSHAGTIFPIHPESLARWSRWWRYLVIDQVLVWAPGCFMGMALPALISLQFASHSTLSGTDLKWSQSLITADGIRHSPQFPAAWGELLWVITVIVGLFVMLPSQLSIVDDICRRWTDIFWSGSRRVRARWSGGEVRFIYYGILVFYVVWSFACAYFLKVPELMTKIIANVNNVALGFTSFQLLWINCRLLPEPLRPRWYQRLGLVACGFFYLGMAFLVAWSKLPEIREWWNG